MNLSMIFSSVKHFVKKNSPEILQGISIAAHVGSLILVGKATLKAKDILDTRKQQLEDIEEVNEIYKGSETYTEEDHKKDIQRVNTLTTVDIVKTFAPVVCLEVGAIAAQLGAHQVMTNRCVSLLTGYLYYKDKYDKSNKIEDEAPFETEEKEKKKEEKPNSAYDHKGFLDYCFTDGSLGWVKNASINLNTLKALEETVNKELNEKKRIITLTDILDHFGVERTKESKKITDNWGWEYNGDKHSYQISFGVFEEPYRNNPMTRAFLDGIEDSVWLHFNAKPLYF